MDHMEGLFRDLLENLHDGVYFVDAERRITFWNKGAEAIAGYPANEVLGSRCMDNLLTHVDEDGAVLCHGPCPIAKTLADGQRRNAEVYLHHKEGHRLPVSVRTSPILDQDGAVVGAVEVFSDNSAQIALLQQLHGLRGEAYVDHLTGLASRRLAEIELGSRLEETRRYGWPFGLLFLDLDHFKQVNDRFGHQTGDAILRLVAQTLVSNLRSFDLAGRWGGDEFVVALKNVLQSELESTANRLRTLVAQSSLTIGDEIVRTSVSIGAVLANATDTPETLVQRADGQMYQSKLEGRNRATCHAG